MRRFRALVFALIPVIALNGCAATRDAAGDSSSGSLFPNGSGLSSGSGGPASALACLALAGVLVGGACVCYVGHLALSPVVAWANGEEWPPPPPSPDEWIDGPVQFSTAWLEGKPERPAPAASLLPPVLRP
jgi:hypothetical protein